MCFTYLTKYRIKVATQTTPAVSNSESKVAVDDSGGDGLHLLSTRKAKKCLVNMVNIFGSQEGSAFIIVLWPEVSSIPLSGKGIW